MTDEIYIRSLSRGFLILQLINLRGSMSLTDLTAQCGLAYPTVSRIVDTLLTEGMIERCHKPKMFRPAALVLSLSLGYRDDETFLSICRKHMITLTRELRWPISLCVRVGMKMMIRETTHDIVPLRLAVLPPGQSMQVLESSSGRACVAFSSREEQKKALNHAHRISGQSDDPDTTPFYTLFDTIKRQGYSLNNTSFQSLHPTDLAAIAVPVFYGGSFNTTLTLTYFKNWMSEDEAVKTCFLPLKKCTDLIANELKTAAPLHPPRPKRKGKPVELRQ